MGQDAAVGARGGLFRDRLRQPKVVTQIDPGVLDVEDPIGAGIVGEQPRDVPGERRLVRSARGHRPEWDGSPASSVA